MMTTTKKMCFGSKIILIKSASNISLRIRELILPPWGCLLGLMILKQITTLDRLRHRLLARKRDTHALSKIMTTKTSMKMWEFQLFLSVVPALRIEIKGSFTWLRYFHKRIPKRPNQLLRLPHNRAPSRSIGVLSWNQLRRIRPRRSPHLWQSNMPYPPWSIWLPNSVSRFLPAWVVPKIWTVLMDFIFLH